MTPPPASVLDHLRHGPSHRRIWALAVPIIVSNLSVPLVGAVDTAVVGHLDDPVAIGAVAIGALVFSFLYWGFGFLRMGTTGFVAQAHGSDDAAEVRAVVDRALLAGLIAGLVVIALRTPALRLALLLLDGSAEVESLASRYFGIRVWSAPAVLAHYVVLGALIGLQRTGTALVLQLVVNGSNVILDILFVPILGWGVAGVAAATLISEYLATVLGLWILLAGPRRLSAASERARILSAKRWRATVRANRDILVRTLCLMAAFAWFTAQGARLGDVVLAANAVLMHLQTFLAYGLDGFAHAVEALAGAARGRRRTLDFDRAVVVSSAWAGLVAVAVMVIYLLAGDGLAGLMTDIPEVREEIARYLPWVVVSPLVSVWSFQLDGIFIGVTATRHMRNAMVASLILYLGAGYLLMAVAGNHGLWLAFLLFMVVRAVTLGAGLPAVRRAMFGLAQTRA